MRISDWSSDVCSSDLGARLALDGAPAGGRQRGRLPHRAQGTQDSRRRQRRPFGRPADPTPADARKVRLDAALAVAVARGFLRPDVRPPQGGRVFSWELPAPSPAFAGGGARSSRLKPLQHGTRHARGGFLRRHAAIPDWNATPACYPSFMQYAPPLQTLQQV